MGIVVIWGNAFTLILRFFQHEVAETSRLFQDSEGSSSSIDSVDIIFANRRFEFRQRSQLLICSVNRWRQTALSNSRKAVSLSSACTTNRFPSPRCASATKIVRPSRSTVATQPQLHPALLRLSAMISQNRFTAGFYQGRPAVSRNCNAVCVFRSPQSTHQNAINRP
jgi:hypothetical protein